MKIEWWNTELPKSTSQIIFNASENKKYSMGSETEVFEYKMQEILDVKYSIAVNNCSNALFIALLANGIGIGDEVIIPNRTFVATAHAVLLTGAKVVLAEVEDKKPLIDLKKIESLISSKTKAIIPVHRNGRGVNIKLLNKIAKRHNLIVIEDAAQALFSKYDNNYIGTESDIGCFSFGMTKFLNTGLGGMLVTNNKSLYEKIIRLRNHGIIKENETYNMLASNFKISDILSTIGLNQLDVIETKRKKFLEIYNLYKNGLANLEYISLLSVNSDNGEIPLWIEVTSNRRNKLMEYLLMKGIETKLFHANLSDSPHIYKGDTIFGHSDYYKNNGFTLPSGPDQNLKEIECVIKLLKGY